ncbi:Ran-specific GTPase-activating protein [Acipenser ruthenus]|uniref:Ran-specific GTPase-activating protein n=1 Tax=Acipenser ruthenus TaxID=7906 RepID=A0A444V0S2_ACIRT|nr:Ran-specific GTPase-activating protein [Acipenser ruthenus]
MSFRKAVRVVCGLAGGSAALLAAAALAESRGVFGEKPGEPGCRRGWSGIAVLRAAQSLTAVNPTVAPSGFGWDSNWDKREPLSLVNSKRKDKETGEGELPTELQNNKPKATRHIFLIRHSQYNLNGQSDKERRLTTLGQEQAEFTGHRLAALGLKYDLLIHSTMTRATETTQIISKYLPGFILFTRGSSRAVLTQLPAPPTPPSTPAPALHAQSDARRAKLYRFASENEPPEWKERGTGDVKLLRHADRGTIRLLMRRDKTLKICANHYIAPVMELKPNAGSDRAWVWNTHADFADEHPKPELLAIRFLNAENAQKFKAKFDDCREQVRKFQQGSDSADKVANKLEELSVKDDKKTNESGDKKDEAACKKKEGEEVKGKAEEK